MATLPADLSTWISDLIKPVIILATGSFLTWIGQRIYKWSQNLLNRYQQLHDVVLGTYDKPGLSTRYEQLASTNEIIKADLRSIRDEVRTNGGNSLKDTVIQINDTLQYMNGTLRVRIDREEGEAHIKMDPSGKVIWASRSYSLWLGRPISDLRDLRWMTYVHPYDRLTVRQEWDQSLTDRRSIDIEFRLWFDPENAYRWVRCLVDPIFGTHDNLLGWYGTLSRLTGDDIPEIDKDEDDPNPLNVI